MFATVMLLLLILMCIALIFVNAHSFWQKKQKKKRSTYLENYSFPIGIQQKIRRRYPHLLDEHMPRIEQAMRQYFRIHQQAGRLSVAMPSKIVDEYWHEFILHTQNYAIFCEKALGRFIHHKPASEPAAGQMKDETLRRAWRLACTDERISTLQTAPRPLVFLIDWELSIPDGFLHDPTLLASAVSSASLDGCSSVTGTAMDSDSSCGDSGGDSGCGGGCGGGGD